MTILPDFFQGKASNSTRTFQNVIDFIYQYFTVKNSTAYAILMNYTFNQTRALLQNTTIFV